MSAKRARRLLLAAIAVSLLMHLIFAGVVRWPLLQRLSQQQQVIRVRELRISRIVPTPPPTPVPTPVRTPVVRSSIAPPVIHSHTVGPPVPHVAASAAAVTPGQLPTPAITPSPVAAHPGQCVSANASPAVESTPEGADISAEIRAAKATGTAAIRVSLDPQGRVTDTTIAQSTGNAGLDSVAMTMARQATYTPQYQGCTAVAGAYTFTVRFVAW